MEGSAEEESSIPCCWAHETGLVDSVLGGLGEAVMGETDCMCSFAVSKPRGQLPW